MTPAQVAALQDPLIAIAGPISRAGAKMPGLYSMLALDTPDHAVNVYLTDVAKAARLLRAAKAADPRLDLSRVRVFRAAYSLARLTGATHRLVTAAGAGRIPFKIFAITQLPGGRGLQLQVPDAVTAQELSARPLAALHGESVRQLAGVTLTVAHGGRMVPASREDDVPPFIGGDYAFGWNKPEQDRPYCTLGIAVENSSGQDGLVEAGHCFTPNNGIYTMNYGRYIGNASGIADKYDAEIIWTGKYNGAGSNADEGETDGCGGICWYPLVQVNDPYQNEYVCQDGISSYLYMDRVPCDIEVGTPTTYYLCPLGDGYCGYVDGIHSYSNDGRPIVVFGDSGGVVFTIHSSSTRNAIGMVDAAGNCNSSGECTLMSFMTANSILGALGVHLNPHT